MTADRVEAELRYRAVDERPLLGLEAAAGLGPGRLGDSRVVTELDRYLDTVDLRLAAVRWACRLRTREGRTIVSLKGPAEHRPGDTLHRRPEVEGPAGAGLDPLAWPPSAARDRLLAIAGGEALVERFHLEQQRTERSVSMVGARVGTLSLDRVQVIHRGTELGRMAIVELELEPVALALGIDLAPLTAALDRERGLVPDRLSKFERAVALLPGG